MREVYKKQIELQSFVTFLFTFVHKNTQDERHKEQINKFLIKIANPITGHPECPAKLKAKRMYRRVYPV